MLPMRKNSIISLGEVERETSPGKDFSRKWHSRHGFPASGRTGEMAGYQHANRLRPALIKACTALPSSVRIWAGGAGAARPSKYPDRS